jgi:hypothetical protein
MALRGDGVLVGFDGVGAEDGACGVELGVAIYSLKKRKEAWVVGVDGGDDGEVVLEFVEVVGCGGGGGDGVVEGVGEGGVVGAKGHFADDMGEVECWKSVLVSRSHNLKVLFCEGMS